MLIRCVWKKSSNLIYEECGKYLVTAVGGGVFNVDEMSKLVKEEYKIIFNIDRETKTYDSRSRNGDGVRKYVLLLFRSRYR